MHVLVVPSWYPTADAPAQGVYFKEQMQALYRDGLHMGVVYPEQRSLRTASWSKLQDHYGQVTATVEANVPTLRHHGWNVWWRHPAGVRRRIRTAVRLAERYASSYGRPDVIHAHSARWAGAAADRIGTRLEVPYVLTEHFSGFLAGDWLSSRTALMQDGFDGAAAVAAVSTALRQALDAHGFVDAEAVAVHPNLVDPRIFVRPSRPHPPPPRLVTITRLDGRKGTDVLLRAFARAFANAPETQLEIVGDGPRRTPLAQLAHRLGIADRVTFSGQQSRAGVVQALHRARAFVLASRRETFGVVLIEAMATGLPVVATTCGGPVDIVAPTTGCLVPVDDEHALADALQAVLDRWSPQTAAVCRHYALDRFGPEPFCRRTRSFYERAL